VILAQQVHVNLQPQIMHASRCSRLSLESSGKRCSVGLACTLPYWASMQVAKKRRLRCGVWGWAAQLNTLSSGRQRRDADAPELRAPAPKVLIAWGPTTGNIHLSTSAGRRVIIVQLSLAGPPFRPVLVSKGDFNFICCFPSRSEGCSGFKCNCRPTHPGDDSLVLDAVCLPPPRELGSEA
jgi:hypothetical protein